MRPPVVVILVALAGPAIADEQRSSAFLWGSALEGTLVANGTSADFDMSLEELLNVFDGGIALRHESRGAARGWYAELVYNDLKRETAGPSGTERANLEQSIVELGLSRPIGVDWELYGGARWEAAELRIDPTLAPSVRSRVYWADAVLGVRWQRGSPRLRWWARGDVAGGGSSGTILFEAGGARSFGDRWSVSLAYRALDTSFEEGPNRLELLQSGAVIGISKDW